MSRTGFFGGSNACSFRRRPAPDATQWNGISGPDEWYVCSLTQLIHPAASVPGTLLTGLLSDHIPIRYTILLSCIAASLSCAFLWGFGKNEGLLITYSLLWGLTGLSFVGSWTKIVFVVSGGCAFTGMTLAHPVTGENHKSAVLVFSLFAALKGCGNFSSGERSPILSSSRNADKVRPVVERSTETGHVPRRCGSIWIQELCEWYLGHHSALG